MKGCKKKAFTLVELLIVVLVLGILAGVAVPKDCFSSTAPTEFEVKPGTGVAISVAATY